MELERLQKPHPPVWYGVHSVVSAERAARQGLNVVSLDPADKTREFTDRFREVWREAQAKNRIAPLIGLGRFIFVAETTRRRSRSAAGPIPFGIGASIIFSTNAAARDRCINGRRSWTGSSKSARVSRAVRRPLPLFCKIKWLKRAAIISSVNSLSAICRRARPKRSLELFTQQVMPQLKVKA